MRILIVEDDLQLGDGLLQGLRSAGFVADWVRDGAAAESALLAESFDALVLDLGLPRMQGTEVLQRLRNRGNRIPVIILTARDAVEDRVTGLDSGADDYLVKPVALAELAARLRALARRAGGESSPMLCVGKLMIDPAARRVTWQGELVDIPPREYAVLEALARNAGRVLTREQLESRLYEWDRSLESNTIEVHIHHLRKKLAAEVIRTVRGVGYMMPRVSRNA